MSKYLRIANRGCCPRILLMILGATTKLDKFEDPEQGGWFGSGTKYAPIAAHNLGIEVHFASTDNVGLYRITYGTKMLPGEKGDIEMIVLQFPDGSETMTMLSTQSAMNWSDPIGDDHVRSYRVLREYLRNAKDEDAESPYLHWVDEVHDARDGRTEVFLTATDEIRHMLKYSDRYFKYVSKTQPLCVVDGFGAIFPKSEKDVTRMFSLIDASLAYCSKNNNDSSLFDYTFFEKKLMTDDRVFSDMTRVYRSLGNMLSQVNDVKILGQILVAMVKGIAKTEVRALSYISKSEQIVCKEAWVEAWRAVYGENAILSTGNVEGDRLAWSQAKKKAVRLDNHVLRKFFILCGVPTSNDFIPLVSEPEYEVVDGDESDRLRLELILDAIHKEYPKTRSIEVHLFVHKNEKWNLSGFAASDSGRPPYTDVYLHLSRLRASTFGAVKTLLHELTHVISGDMHGLEFILVDDCQRALLFMEKHGTTLIGDTPPDLQRYIDYLEATELRSGGVSESEIALRNAIKASKEAAKKQGGE